MKFQLAMPPGMHVRYVVLMKDQEFPLMGTQGRIFGAETPVGFLQTSLCPGQVLEADRNIEILGLPEPNVSIDLERQERPFDGHRWNTGLVKALEDRNEYLKVPDRLDAAGVASLLQLGRGRCRYFEPGNALQNRPTDGGSAVSIDQAKIFTPIGPIGADGANRCLLTITPIVGCQHT
jgi:hypothetical protein